MWATTAAAILVAVTVASATGVAMAAATVGFRLRMAGVVLSQFDVTKQPNDTSQPNPGLDRVARAVNLFASVGVPSDKRDFVAVIHGPATPSVLTDEQYEKRFGQNNPNTRLIAALHDADVTSHVCGQAHRAWL
ncbi:hypothetical protein [Salinisphaera hydrothermalis]|uniref:hypothetical protein n=1 Tax=Salinisphaera hydrothermalis TaxID=563188 RepID=UPI0033424669